ncbi:MAG: DUF2304 family protein [Saprospiraceae bacterium]|nr:DUF2304 family protein [Saprospiraceae bacterium]
MELRIFQIIVPLFALLFIGDLMVSYRKSKVSVFELTLGLGFWVGVLAFAIFPDFISRGIAQLFGIKDNVNAIIFFCIGLLFFFQFKQYFLIRKQEKNLTLLMRKIALQDHQLEKEE